MCFSLIGQVWSRRKFIVMISFVVLSLIGLANVACAQDKLLSLNFHAIAVRDLLQMLTENSGKNVIISDKVSGRISLTLQHVTWQEALNMVLNMQGLTKQETNNTLMITVASGAESAAMQIPQPISIFHLHYSQAEDVIALLGKQKNLLSAMGSVSADARTNSILIQDVPMHLSAIWQFLKTVDMPVQQLLIEGRIVSIDSNYTHELGLKFGSVAESNNDHGDKSGGVSEDLPTAASDPGHFNIALAKLGNGSILDMTLSALETEGHANIISSPKLLTANNKAAYIESGQEIPYQEKTSSGATSVAFKKAVLSLKVTPQIINRNKILLHLQLNQDKLSSVTVEGVPAIQTQEIKTDVEVNDRQTLILGGIYEFSQTDNVTKVPLLGDIPLLGKMFQNKQVATQRKELLIFVSPKMIE